MALETLKEVSELSGFDIMIMDNLKKAFPDKFDPVSGAMKYEWFEKEIRPNFFIYLRNDTNSLSFTIQNGPVEEVGINGCQVDSILEACYYIIKGLNEKFQDYNNKKAICHIEAALLHLRLRKVQRIIREVEGRNTV